MKFLFAFLLFSLSTETIFAQIEERGYIHEFDLGFVMGTSFKLNFNPIDHSNTNGIFPSSDSLDQMTFRSYKTYQPLNIQFSYTKWFQNRKNPTGVQFGVKGQITTGYTVSVSESWKSFRQWTYDTLVSQSTGEKYPRDSIREDEFSASFSGHTVQIDLGFRMLVPIKERYEFVAGLDFGTAWFRKQEVQYQYTKIEDLSETTDEEGNIQRFSRNITEEKHYTTEYEVDHSIYQLSLPLEFRFVGLYRRHDRPTFILGNFLENIRFSLQVTPTLISIHANEARTFGFSAVFGVGIAFCI